MRAQRVQGLAARAGLTGRALSGEGLRLSFLLHLAGDHPGLKHAPNQLLTSDSHVGASLASAVPEPPYAQKLDEVVIVQIQLRLAALDHGIDGVADPFGAFLFVHSRTPFVPSRSFRSSREGKVIDQLSDSIVREIGRGVKVRQRASPCWRPAFPILNRLRLKKAPVLDDGHRGGIPGRRQASSCWPTPSCGS